MLLYSWRLAWEGEWSFEALPNVCKSRLEAEDNWSVWILLNEAVGLASIINLGVSFLRWIRAVQFSIECTHASSCCVYDMAPCCCACNQQHCIDICCFIHLSTFLSLLFCVSLHLTESSHLPFFPHFLLEYSFIQFS